MDEHYLDGRERAGGFAAGDQWRDIDISAALEESHASREERLEQDLERIAEQLEGRDELHADIVDELEWKIDRYTDRLESLYTTGRGKEDGERNRVKQRLTEIYRELRDEHREHWQDRQALERERRDVLRELAALDDDNLLEML
jgi:trichohyalin